MQLDETVIFFTEHSMKLYCCRWGKVVFSVVFITLFSATKQYFILLPPALLFAAVSILIKLNQNVMSFAAVITS